MEDRTAQVREMIRRFNARRPDVVLCTGDLISRYDEHKQPLPPEVIRWQIEWLRQYLPGLEAPLPTTIGNHDVAFAETRRHWCTAMGGGLGCAPDDWSIDWGVYHLAMPDCFAYYGENNVAMTTSFRPEQIAWLQRDLGSVSGDGVHLLFAHYDYQEQLPVILPSLGLDAFFYGHSQSLYPEVLQHYGIWDGHLAGKLAYRLVHLIGRDVIEQDCASWDLLA